MKNRVRVAAGHRQIREGWTRLQNTMSRLEVGPERPALRSGDLAMTSRRNPGGDVNVEVARRQPDGTWRWVIDQPDAVG